MPIFMGHGSWRFIQQNKQWMIPILVNLESGKWTTDLRTTFAKHAPTQHMLLALKKFYGQDITHIKLILAIDKGFIFLSLLYTIKK